MNRASSTGAATSTMSPVFVSSQVNGASDAEAFVAERWADIERAVGDLRGDRVIFVTEESVCVRERRPLLRFLRRELPHVPFKMLRRPAPAGAVLLVVLRAEEIGVAAIRPVSPWVGAA